jgi:hypothetical protein
MLAASMSGRLIARLVAHDLRFGLNYLVTPVRLRTLDVDILR